MYVSQFAHLHASITLKIACGHLHSKSLRRLPREWTILPGMLSGKWTSRFKKLCMRRRAHLATLNLIDFNLGLVKFRRLHNLIKCGGLQKASLIYGADIVIRLQKLWRSLLLELTLNCSAFCSLDLKSASFYRNLCDVLQDSEPPTLLWLTAYHGNIAILESQPLPALPRGRTKQQELLNYCWGIIIQM